MFHTLMQTLAEYAEVIQYEESSSSVTQSHYILIVIFEFCATGCDVRHDVRHVTTPNQSEHTKKNFFDSFTKKKFLKFTKKKFF